jgi:hypothetical protein
MPVDSEFPTSVPPITPTSPAEADLDPDAMDDEDFREEQQREEEGQQRPVDWDEPPSGEVLPADAPTPLSDDLR